MSCAKQGRRDVDRHLDTNIHKNSSKIIQSNQKISFAPSINEQVIKSELEMVYLLVTGNIQLAFMDRFNQSVDKLFPDSEIAKKYLCGKTKTSCILNGALAPHFKNNLIDRMKNGPFSLGTDGSNDNGEQKMNVLIVYLFDKKKTRVTTEFLSMCSTTGPHSGTADKVFKKINDEMIKFEIPWENCRGFSVDSAPVNVGVNCSLTTMVHIKNPSIFFMGCPCHKVHNAASKGMHKFTLACGFDLEEFAVDIYYWFDKSTNRKGTLKNFCELCDTQYRKMLKHISVRWLSLDISINRCLKQFIALESYFIDTPEKGLGARFLRLKNKFSDPMTEVYLLFMQSIF